LATQRRIAEAIEHCGLSGQIVLRKGKDGHVFVTDGGHWIIDAHLGRIENVPVLAALLIVIPGVVEHGLFTNMASTVVLAGGQGIRVIERQ
jgi:ribose 5-phosphate isomerase A